MTDFRESSAPIGIIEYTLDDPSISFGPYKFQQTPDCGYKTVESTTGLPDAILVTHDK